MSTTPDCQCECCNCQNDECEKCKYGCQIAATYAEE